MFNEINGHEYVDLGLPSGLKWATCNIGADKPEDYGNYYAWGETETKTEYNHNNYTYLTNQITDISGTHYDVARNKWGSTWRMPTYNEMQELINYCTWETRVISKGVRGCKVTGPNGNTLFFPCAGGYSISGLGFDELDGYYWTSTPGNNNDNTYDNKIYYTYFLSFSSITTISLIDYTRNACVDCGHTIRPVSE